MKVVICDYKDVLDRELEYEKDIIKNGIKDVDISVYEYKGDNEEFIKEIEDADAILTAFLDIDKDVINKCKNLKCISINAVGYDTVDLETARKNNVTVCAIEEYCTQEVAEHTLALILSLNRGIKHYINDIDNKNVWKYQSITGLRRLEGQTLGVYGFGRIGRSVAKRAQGFGINVVAVDPYISQEFADKYGVKIVDSNYINENADIISNHMNQNNSNNNFFNLEEFKKMKKNPIFINVGRGSCVNEKDLLIALERNYIRGAGLDVLEAENPDIKNNKLVKRENVIITPHAAFYSETSMRELQRISCENIVNFFNNNMEGIKRIVS